MRTARDIAHEIMTPPVSAKVSAALLGFEGDLEDLLVEAIEKAREEKAREEMDWEYDSDYGARMGRYLDHVEGN